MPSTTPKKTLYIFGAGGHGREAAWLAERVHGDNWTRIFLVSAPRFREAAVLDGLNVVLLDGILSANAVFVIAIGNPKRKQLIRESHLTGINQFGTLIDPAATISPYSSIAEGAMIFAGSVISSGAKLGAHVHINFNCTVSHDVRIGQYSTLSPGAGIAGNVVVGQRVFIGIGAKIINGSTAAPLTIGDDAVIAAGACVTKSVPSGVMVAGVPATIRAALST